MTPHLHSFLEYWYLAQSEPLGIYLKVSNYHLAMNKLYLARTESGDLSLKSIQLKRSPRSPSDEIWLVNMTVGGEPTMAHVSLDDLTA